MTKELVQLLKEIEPSNFEEYHMIPENLTGVMQSLKFVYSEEDIDALVQWRLEEIQDTSLSQWTVELKDHLESVSEFSINSLESLLDVYIQVYGNRIEVLTAKVKEIIARDNIDLNDQIIYAMNKVYDIIQDILGESNTGRTYELLTNTIYAKLN